MDPPIDDFGSLIADGNAEGAERPADKPTNSLLRALQLSNYYAPLRGPNRRGNCSNESGLASRMQILRSRESCVRSGDWSAEAAG